MELGVKQNMSMKIVWIIDGVCIVLFLLLMAFVFVMPSQQEALIPLFSILYRTGAWIIGAGLVCTCLWGKGRAGLILGIIMLVLYLITAFITLFGLMALTDEWELLWYIHPVLVIPGCIFVLWYRKRNY